MTRTNFNGLALFLEEQCIYKFMNDIHRWTETQKLMGHEPIQITIDNIIHLLGVLSPSDDLLKAHYIDYIDMYKPHIDMYRQSLSAEWISMDHTFKVLYLMFHHFLM